MSEKASCVTLLAHCVLVYISVGFVPYSIKFPEMHTAMNPVYKYVN